MLYVDAATPAPTATDQTAPMPDHTIEVQPMDEHNHHLIANVHPSGWQNPTANGRSVDLRRIVAKSHPRA